MSWRSGRSSTHTSEIASPTLAGAAGAADAVDVVLGDVRQLVVDDVGQVLDVEAARGDVGRDEDLHLAALKSSSASDALALALVAVDRGGADAVLASCSARRLAPCLVR